MMMKLFKTVFIHTLIVIVLGVNCSCTSLLEREQFDAFSKRTRDYGKLLRWGQYSDAARMRRSPMGVLDVADVEPLKEIRVTSYRITGSELSSDPGKGIVYASLDFYHERENRIRTIHDQQLWWYDTERERWYLDGDLPAFITQ
jgi:hypothetical protein